MTAQRTPTAREGEQQRGTTDDSPMVTKPLLRDCIQLGGPTRSQGVLQVERRFYEQLWLAAQPPTRLSLLVQDAKIVEATCFEVLIRRSLEGANNFEVRENHTKTDLIATASCCCYRTLPCVTPAPGNMLQIWCLPRIITPGGSKP